MNCDEIKSKVGPDDEITIWVDREGIGMHQDGLCSAKELLAVFDENAKLREALTSILFALKWGGWLNWGKAAEIASKALETK